MYEKKVIYLLINDLFIYHISAFSKKWFIYYSFFYQIFFLNTAKYIVGIGNYPIGLKNPEVQAGDPTSGLALETQGISTAYWLDILHKLTFSL